MLYRIGQAAEMLGVSPDTVRRWVDSGRLASARTSGGRRLVDGASLARLAGDQALTTDTKPARTESARNRMIGIVTKVTKDKVMAQVELAAGPFRIVSLISREAADELGLAPGVQAVASIKATNVVLELPRQ